MSPLWHERGHWSLCSHLNTCKDCHNRERIHGMSEPSGMLIRCSVTNWQLIVTWPVGDDEGKEPRAVSRGDDPRDWLVGACIGRASCRYVVRQAGCVYLNAGIRVIVGRGRALHQRQLPAGPRDRNIHQAQSAERGRGRRRHGRWTSHCSRDRGRHAPDKTLIWKGRQGASTRVRRHRWRKTVPQLNRNWAEVWYPQLAMQIRSTC